MTTIQQTFSDLKRRNQKAIIPFLTADFPNRDTFLRLLYELPNSGASIIEIGIPFSEPMADGIVIQQSSHIAIQNGFSFPRLLADITAFRRHNTVTPIVLMTYINPLIHYGMDACLQDAAKSGVQGMLIVDLPPEHTNRCIQKWHGLDSIHMITPTTNDRRLAIIQEGSGGFLYYVSVTGVTGTQSANATSILPHIQRIRTHVSLPIVVGFGITGVSIAKQMADLSDGVVVGSHILKPFLTASTADYGTIVNEQLMFIDEVRHHLDTV
jgi:tryptophan synthase alpha chain